MRICSSQKKFSARKSLARALVPASKKSCSKKPKKGQNSLFFKFHKKSRNGHKIILGPQIDDLNIKKAFLKYKCYGFTKTKPAYWDLCQGEKKISFFGPIYGKNDQISR